jgi:hypothetical protein
LKSHGQRVSVHFLAASLALLVLGTFSAPSSGQFKRNSGTAPQPQSATDAPDQLKKVDDHSNPSKSSASGSPSLDSLKLPAGAIVVLCEQAQQALELIPRAVVLAPEEYQKLVDQIEQFKKRLKNEKPEAPSICRLSGRVERGTAYIHAQFEFKTASPRASVNLGCRRGWPTNATLDGKLPSLQSSEDGYVLRIEEPGTHTATLDLVVPLTSGRGRNLEQSVDLDLPRSAIMTLEQFDLPPGSVDVKVGNQVVQATDANKERTRVGKQPLAAGDHIEIAWREPNSQVVNGPAVYTASARLVIGVQTKRVATDATLALEMLRGQATEWKIAPHLPPGATFEVRASPEDETRVQAISRSEDPKAPLVTIRLKEAAAEPVRLVFHVQQPLTSQFAPAPWFEVIGALSQKGEIEVRAAENVRLYYEPGSTTSQRSLSEDQRRDGVRAAFSYWTLSSSASPDRLTTPLALQGEALKGAAEMRVAHSLRMVKTSSGAVSFEVRTKIDVTPIRTAIDHIELVFPPGYRFDKSEGALPVDLVEDLVLDSGGQKATVKLVQKQSQPFSVTIPGSYDVPERQHRLTAELPKPVAWGSDRLRSSDATPGELWPVLDRGGQVKIVLLEGLELVSKDFRLHTNPTATALPTFLLPVRSKATDKEYLWQSERMPERTQLLWQEYRPPLSVHSVADVLITGQQARVRQRLRFDAIQAGLSQVLLRIPPGLEGKVRIVGGGTLQRIQDGGRTELAVNFARPAPRDQTLDLEYVYPAPEWMPAPTNGDGTSPERSSSDPASASTRIRRLTLHLVQAVGASSADSKVRLWCDSADQAAVANSEWEELPAEVVSEHESLPKLVLRGPSDRPLVLTLSRTLLTSTAGALIDRILMHVETKDSGVQVYRCRFLVSQLSARELIVDLPAVLPRTALSVRFGGKAVTFQVLDDSGRESDVGKKIRIRYPLELIHPEVLEIRYELDAVQLAGNGPAKSTFYPPRIRNAILLGRLRWDIAVPLGWVPIYCGSTATAEQRWGWMGWLLTPRPALSPRALEQWLEKADGVPSEGERNSDFLAWQTGPDALELVRVPARLWTLACSLTLLIVGSLLLFAPLSRPVFWLLLAAVASSAAAIELLWPGMLPGIIAGSEPGIVILLLSATVYAVIQQRLRRRVVLMPGFMRAIPVSGSTNSGATAVKRDPASAAAMPKRGSSVAPQVPV